MSIGGLTSHQMLARLPNVEKRRKGRGPQKRRLR